MAKEKEKSKEKISKDLNDMLGLTIDFTKLSAEELKALHEVFTVPGKFIPVIGKVVRGKWPKTILKQPVGDFFGISQQETEGRGPFGLGIIPSLTEGIRDRLGPRKEGEEKSEPQKEGA